MSTFCGIYMTDCDIFVSQSRVTTITPTEALSLLVSLTTDISGTPGATLNLALLLDFFQRAPFLRSLRLASFDTRVFTLPVRFPWPQLRSLTIGGSVPIDELTTRAILIQCPKLENCDLCGIVPTEEALQVPPVATLDSLSSLRTSDGEDGEGDLPVLIFLSFTFPRLTP